MSEPQRFHGQDAVLAAGQYYGQKQIDPIAAHIIEEEGFVAGQYYDDAETPVLTEGVGLTGDNIGKNFFTEVYPKYLATANRAVPQFSQLPEQGQKAIISAIYRGDLGPKTAKHLRAGEYKKASVEYLKHDEYKKRLRKDPNNGVVKRMQRNAAAMASLED